MTRFSTGDSSAPDRNPFCCRERLSPAFPESRRRGPKRLAAFAAAALVVPFAPVDAATIGPVAVRLLVADGDEEDGDAPLVSEVCTAGGAGRLSFGCDTEGREETAVAILEPFRPEEPDSAIMCRCNNHCTMMDCVESDTVGSPIDVRCRRGRGGRVSGVSERGIETIG